MELPFNLKHTRTFIFRFSLKVNLFPFKLQPFVFGLFKFNTHDPIYMQIFSSLGFLPNTRNLHLNFLYSLNQDKQTSINNLHIYHQSPPLSGMKQINSEAFIHFDDDRSCFLHRFILFLRNPPNVLIHTNHILKRKRKKKGLRDK